MISHLLICGLGSIGRRHLSNFLQLGVSRIDCFSSGKSTIKDPVYTNGSIYSSLTSALAQKPQAAVICNPTALHLPVAQQCVESNLHLLIEKPLSNTLDGVYHLQDLSLSLDRRVAVGFNMRFYPLISSILSMLSKRTTEFQLLSSDFSIKLVRNSSLLEFFNL